jgi:serine/threonine protein kinase
MLRSVDLPLRSFPLQTEPGGHAPDDTFGPFRVLHQIGAGVLGPVFRAYDPESERLVAIKLFRLDLPPERVHQLVDEFQWLIAASLTHPGIAAPIATGICEAQPFLAQEYVTAESLDVAIRDSGPLQVADALRVATQLAAALDFAAVANIAHGALHPRDVLVSPEQTRLTGIGVAHALEEIGAVAPVRRPYTAPERVGGVLWNRRADVFSLAALVHEMLWGRRVVGTGTQAAESLTELSGADLETLRATFARALDENPAERFETALEFAQALKNAFSEIAPSRPGLPTPGVRPPTAVAELQRPRQSTTDDRLRTEEAEPLLPLDEPPFKPEGHKDFDVAEVFQQPDPQVDRDIRVDQSRFANLESTSPPIVPMESPLGESGRGPATTDRASEHAVPAGLMETYQVTAQPSGLESSRSAIWPLALALVVGLALGFAGGYGVGLRDRTAPVVATSPSLTEPVVAAPAAVSVPVKRPAVEPIGNPVRSSTGSGRPEFVLGRPKAEAAETIATTAAATARNRPAATAGQVGQLTLRSVPSSALVFLDGKASGRTPTIFRELARGAHRIQVTRDGYTAVDRRVVIAQSGPSQTVTLRLPRAPVAVKTTPAAGPVRVAPATTDQVKGSVDVDSRPSGAKVFVDGRLVGKTPMMLSDVSVGDHAIRLELDGYARWSSSVRIVLNEQNRVTASLEK